MAVPNLPFWCSAANTEFQEHAHGWLKETGRLAELNRPFWASELAGRSASLPIGSGNFSVAGFIPGARYGGYGPPGRPGVTGSGHRVDFVPCLNNYRSNTHGTKYRANRTLAFFGRGVGEKHLAAAGITLSQAIGTSRNLKIALAATVDHDVHIGMFQFHKDRPWSGSYVTVYSHIYGAGGRQSFNGTWNLGAPPADHIWVPYIYTRQGESDISITVSTR